MLEFLAGFDRVGIRPAQGSGIRKFQPAAEAIGFLEDRLSGWKQGDQTYWDVFASRERLSGTTPAAT
ncbi:MAG TPA: hypothetical protein VME47_11805 [Acetobacteraceae bacterium]|nr:hypothetical protein [Acetobacteraceae bacterium]